MIDTKMGTNNIIPDIRPDKIETYEESYTPPLAEDETEAVTQTATYKIIDMHPILSGILNKLAYLRTHAAATWYNKLAGKTVKDKFDEVDTAIESLNNNMIFADSDDEIVIGSYSGKPLYRKRIMNGETVSSGMYDYDASLLHIDKFLKGYGVLKTGSGYSFPIGYCDPYSSHANMYLETDGITIRIQCTVGGTKNGYYGYVYIEYTKTTD